MLIELPVLCDVLPAWFWASISGACEGASLVVWFVPVVLSVVDAVGSDWVWTGMLALCDCASEDVSVVCAKDIPNPPMTAAVAIEEAIIFMEAIFHSPSDLNDTPAN